MERDATNSSKHPSLCVVRLDCQDLLHRLSLVDTFANHDGCVNTVTWNEAGTLLLSGSDDRHLVITDPFCPPGLSVKARIRSGHTGNIFSAKFLPNTNDVYIASCAGDGLVILTVVDAPATYGTHQLSCHSGTVYEVATFPHEPFTFLTCAEDGSVRLFDRREKMSCIPCRDDITIMCKRAVCAMDVNKTKPYEVALGCSDGSCRLYDLRQVSRPYTDELGMAGLMSCFCPDGKPKRSRRVTSIDFSPDGNELLVSFSSDYVYLVDTTRISDQPIAFDSSEMDDSSTVVRKVRFRGDWSDSGPQARPESEQTQRQNTAQDAEDQGSPPARGPVNARVFMERFSDIVSQWLRRQVSGEDEPDTEVDDAAAVTDRDGINVGASTSASSGGQPGNPEQAVTDVLALLLDGVDNNLKQTYQSDESQMEQTPSVDEPSTSAASGTLPSFEPAPGSQVVHDALPLAADATTGFSNGHVLRVRPRGVISAERVSDDGRQPSIQVSAADDDVNDEAGVSNDLTQGEGMQENVRSPIDRERQHRRAAVIEKLKQEAKRRLREREDLGRSLTSIPQLEATAVFRGHRNCRTMLKQAAFWGSRYVMSGSDCGHVFVWDRHDQSVAMVLEGDTRVVNCIQPHPVFPILATSGIDYDIKLWMPTAEQSSRSQQAIDELVQRNEVMLEETKDTVTVPAAFMIRMLASMNSFRANRRQQQSSEPDDDAE